MIVTIGYRHCVAVGYAHGDVPRDDIEATEPVQWVEVVEFETEQRFLEWYRRKVKGEGVMKFTGNDISKLKSILGDSCAEKIIAKVGVEGPVVSKPAKKKDKDK